jgi:hypothetical protein
VSASAGPQIGLFSRRRFFRWTSSLPAMIGVPPLLASEKALAMTATKVEGEGKDYYDKLGVSKIINAAGTYTPLTAACMPPVVLAAVQKSALHPVRLADLQIKAGEYIAQRLKCEGAVVTSGASRAITLATAAWSSICKQHQAVGHTTSDRWSEKSIDRTACPPLRLRSRYVSLRCESDRGGHVGRLQARMQHWQRHYD